MRTSNIRVIQTFYDEFSTIYDSKRVPPAYSLVRSPLQLEKVIPLARSKTVIEMGCGTGLLLEEVNKFAKSAYGFDISGGMLRNAHKRGLNVVEGSVDKLPFKAEIFDLVYSFKTLPHIPNIELAVKEMTRVTKHGGYLVLEFYNPYGWAGRWKIIIGGETLPFARSKVYQRFDSYNKIEKYLPEDLKIKSLRGIKIFTPSHGLYKIPLFRWLDRTFCDSSLAKFADYLVIVAQRR